MGETPLTPFDDVIRPIGGNPLNLPRLPWAMWVKPTLRLTQVEHTPLKVTGFTSTDRDREGPETVRCADYSGR